MDDRRKTKEQLVNELARLRRRVAELEAADTERKQAEEALHKREELFQAFIEHSSDVITIIDAHGTVQYQSPNYKILWGRDPSGEIGRDVYKDVHPDDVALVSDRFNYLLRNPEGTVHTEVRARHEDGSWLTLDIVGHNLLDNPAVHGIVVHFRDITARRQAEEATVRAAQEWQTTFDSTNNAIWILDQDQRVLRSNKTAERLFRRPGEELIGKHCWEIVHGTAQPIPECPILRAKNSLRRESMELQIGEGWFEVTVDPILDAAGRYSGAVHIVSDITERKQAEAQLTEQLDELRRWHQATLGRETRILDLKHEVNELLAQTGQPPRYPSAETENQ